MQFNNYKDASNPNHNVWVSASAGSGKTKLLVDRFLRLIIAGAKLDEILCITFTKAAASEMLDRVKQILEEWLQISDEELSKELVNLEINPTKEKLEHARTAIFEFLDNNHRLKIATIHSICQEILSRFPLESGSKISSKIIDDNEKEKLIITAKHQLLETDFSYSENLQALFENISEFSISKIIDNILSFECLSFEWANITENKNDIIQRIDEFFGNISKEKIQQDEKHLLAELKKLSQQFFICKDQCEIIQQIDEALHSNEENQIILQNIKPLFFTLNNKPRAKLLKKEIKEQFPLLNDLLLDYQIQLENFFESYSNYKLRLISKGLCEIKYIFDQIYKDIKYQQSYYDFNDIINETFKLLSNPEQKEWVKYKFGSKFKHILVDESQDTNIAQWKIIDAISSETFLEEKTSLFVVGDEKQSIYSFQGASPLIFGGIKQFYKKQFQQCNKHLTEISLQRSFRSSQIILDFIDNIFAKILQDYRSAILDRVDHKAFFDFDCSYIEIFPIIYNAKEKSEKIKNWQIPVQREEYFSHSYQNAELIIEKIKFLLESGYKESDILILIRKRDDFSNYLTRKIKDAHITIDASNRIKLSQHIAIKDILSFAEFLLYPYDDLNLASLLKSHFFAFNEQELFELCHDRKNTLWEELQLHPSPKAKKASDLLKNYADSPITNNIYDFFFDLLIGKQYIKSFYEKLGKEAEEVIHSFLDACTKYQDTNRRNLGEFIAWFKHSNIEASTSNSSGLNEVRLMTIHGSKGLQSEIVILADAVSTPRMTDNLFWDDLNNIPIFNGNGKYSSNKYSELRESMKDKIFDEYFRLLYVALTRAKSQLYIFGHGNDEKASDYSWYNYIKTASENYFLKRELKESEKRLIQNDEIVSEVYFHGNFLTKKKDKMDNSKKTGTIVIPESITPKAPLELEIEELVSESFRAKKLGIFVHKFLELTISREQVDEEMLRNTFLELSKYYDIQISKDLLSRILSCHRKISSFCDRSIAIRKEQELIFKQDSKYTKIILDLMIEKEDEIIIADYKLSSLNQENRGIYTWQLHNYKKILQKSYPNKEIKCCIIWVTESEFDFV